MKKQVLFGLFYFLISCYSATCLFAQTLRESSEKAYSLLNSVKSSQKITLLHEIISYRLIDSVDRAKTLAFKAIEESKKQKSEKLEAASLLYLASVYFSKNNPDSAEFCISKAGKYYERNVGDLNYANFLSYKGRINLLNNNTKEAIQYYNQSIVIASKLNDYRTLGNAYWNLAEYYKKTQNPKEFLLNLTKAEESCRRYNNTIHTGRMFIGLGVSYLDLGMNEKANQQFITALQQLEKTADSLFLAYTYTNIATMYVSPTREKSREYYKKAIEIFKLIKNEKGAGYACNLFAQDYLSTKEYEKAILYFKEAARNNINSSDWQGACFVNNNLAETYLQLNDSANAKKMLEIAGKMSAKASDKLSTATYLNTKGIYFRYIKNYDSALVLLKESLKLYRELNIKSLVSDNLLDISETYQQQGNLGEALKHYKLYTSTKDSIENASNAVQIADLQLKYESEKKDSQIKSLLNQSLSSKKGQFYVYGNIIGLFLLLLFALFIFTRYKGSYSKRVNSIINPQTNELLDIEKPLELYSTAIADKATKPILTTETKQQLWLQLKDLIETEGLFLNKELTLAQCARKLNTNTTYLSKVINETTGSNFSCFLNQYRIEEACRLLLNPKTSNMTIEGIAQTVGFNSKSVFNMTFKKYKHVTPSEFIANQRAKFQSVG